jgi:hypothetical protein
LERLDAEAARRIADLLGAPLSAAPYRAGGEPVFELKVRSRVLGVNVTLHLWTGLGRADIRIGDSSLVFKRIDAVELYPGVEVLFRRFEPPGYMFLSVDGRASLVI